MKTESTVIALPSLHAVAVCPAVQLSAPVSIKQQRKIENEDGGGTKVKANRGSEVKPKRVRDEEMSNIDAADAPGVESENISTHSGDHRMSARTAGGGSSSSFIKTADVASSSNRKVAAESSSTSKTAAAASSSSSKVAAAASSSSSKIAAAASSSSSKVAAANQLHPRPTLRTLNSNVAEQPPHALPLDPVLSPSAVQALQQHADQHANLPSKGSFLQLENEILTAAMQVTLLICLHVCAVVAALLSCPA
jgi:hypothetical protein